MTQTTFTDNVLVDGSQDTTQLRVQGHTTQTQPLQTWENSAGTPQARVSGDGNVQIGDDLLGWSTPDALLEAHRAEASTSKPKRGIHSLGQVSGTLNALVQWIAGELELRGSSAIDALHTALRIRASNMNTGTPTANAELRGADIEVINDASAGSSALTKATGLLVAVTNAAGKLITEAVGLRIKLNNAGTITNPYAIYVEGVGVVHLEDYLEMKRLAAAPGTPATDFVRIYGKSDGKLYVKNWSGQEYDLTAGGGSGGSGAASILPNSSFENWENGTAAPPDGWVLTGTGAAVAREGTIVKHGNYSAKLTRAGNDCHLSFDVYPVGGKTYMRSRQYTLGAWVYATVANRVRLRVNDGTTTTYSSYHSGGSAWEYLTVTFTPASGATVVNVGLAVDGGDTSGYLDGAVVVEGAVAGAYQPQLKHFNDFPQRVTFWPDEAKVTTGSAIESITDTGSRYDTRTYQEPPANGDTFTQSFFLRAGTYTLAVLGISSGGRGIADWYVDNVFQFSQDWYSTSLTRNVLKTGTITVIGDGYHVLKGVVNGKNASSSNYYYDFNKYWIYPAVD